MTVFCAIAFYTTAYCAIAFSTTVFCAIASCMTSSYVMLPQDEMDPAYALLFEHVSAADPSVRLHAVMGLALAYAGTQKEEVCLPLKLIAT